MVQIAGVKIALTLNNLQQSRECLSVVVLIFAVAALAVPLVGFAVLAVGKKAG